MFYLFGTPCWTIEFSGSRDSSRERSFSKLNIFDFLDRSQVDQISTFLQIFHFDAHPEQGSRISKYEDQK